MEYLHPKREIKDVEILEVERCSKEDLEVGRNALTLLIGSKLNERSPPQKHPKWRQHGGNTSQQTSNEFQSREGQTQSPTNDCGVESYQISKTFRLIRTLTGEFYGEFHGEFIDSDFPEELLHDDDGNSKDTFR